MANQSSPSKQDRILIVGAGVFGLSTALELKKRGYQDVVVLDRHMPPVVDGSSVDISRVIRTDYADPLYARMAREAYAEWTGAYSQYYHHSGFVMVANKEGNAYIEKSNEVNNSMGSSLDIYEDARDVKRVYPNMISNLEGLRAYGNPRGGWADAEGSIRHLASLCDLAGVSFITGAQGTVRGLVRNGNDVVTGVSMVAGTKIAAQRVILATGAWTNRLVAAGHATSASGQSVGFIQLTPDEAKIIENTPVIINLSTGFFSFPPTPNTHILKVARHGYGFATSVDVDESEGAGEVKRVVSSPKRDGNNAAASYLPEDAERDLREGLRQLMPDFADREWMSRRLCWYSDTQQGDFVVDNHPRFKGLFLATGGAGHAFKFLPVLGRYVADCFEDKAEEEIRQKWRLKPATGSDTLVMKGDGSRGGPELRTLSQKEQSKL